MFSPVSYIIENAENSLDPKNEYSISKDEINTLLNGKTFADFTTYVTYSYFRSESLPDDPVHADRSVPAIP